MIFVYYKVLDCSLTDRQTDRHNIFFHRQRIKCAIEPRDATGRIMSTLHTIIWFCSAFALVCADAEVSTETSTDGSLIPEAVFNDSDPHRWTDPHDRMVGLRCDEKTYPHGGVEADNGEILFGCGSAVFVWNPVTDKIRITLEGFSKYRVRNIATSGDIVAATVSNDGVLIWCLRTGRSIHSWTLQPDMHMLSRAITCIAVGNDVIFVGTDRGMILAWHHRSGVLKRITVPRSGDRLSPITCMWASADGQRLLIGSQDGRVREWKPSQQWNTWTIFWAPDAVWYVTPHPRLDVIAISTREDVLIVDIDSSDVLQRKPGSASAIFFDGDDTFIWQEMGSEVLTLSSIRTGVDVGEMSSFGRHLLRSSTCTFILARRHESVILMPDVHGGGITTTFALVKCDFAYYYSAMAMKRGYADGELERGDSAPHLDPSHN